MKLQDSTSQGKSPRTANACKANSQRLQSPDLTLGSCTIPCHHLRGFIISCLHVRDLVWPISHLHSLCAWYLGSRFHHYPCRGCARRSRHFPAFWIDRAIDEGSLPFTQLRVVGMEQIVRVRGDRPDCQSGCEYRNAPHLRENVKNRI